MIIINHIIDDMINSTVATNRADALFLIKKEIEETSLYQFSCTHGLIIKNSDEDFGKEYKKTCESELIA
jgi:hypothetical protein